MDLDRAREVAGRFVGLIAPACERVLIVGSIRRKKTEVGDIDIVAMPKHEDREAWFDTKKANLLEERIRELLDGGKILPRAKKDGKTMIGHGVAFVEFEKEKVDLYYSPDEDHWYGLVLVRTGSAAHNQRLATMALHQGKHFHADGTGIWDGENARRLDDGRSEESIFAELGIAYLSPSEREVL